MSTSGTVGMTKISVQQFIDHGAKRAGKLSEELTVEQVQAAKTSFFYLLSSLANQGVNYWAINKVILGLTPNQYEYYLPLGTVDVLNANYRTLTNVSTGAYSTSGTTLNAFDGLGTARLRFDGLRTARLSRGRPREARHPCQQRAGGRVLQHCVSRQSRGARAGLGVETEGGHPTTDVSGGDPGGDRRQDHRPRNSEGALEKCHREMLRWRYHAQAQALGKAEGRQEAHEASWQGQHPAGSFHFSPEIGVGGEP